MTPFALDAFAVLVACGVTIWIVSLISGNANGNGQLVVPPGLEIAPSSGNGTGPGAGQLVLSSGQEIIRHRSSGFGVAPSAGQVISFPRVGAAPSAGQDVPSDNGNGIGIDNDSGRGARPRPRRRIDEFKARQAQLEAHTNQFIEHQMNHNQFMYGWNAYLHGMVNRQGLAILVLALCFVLYILYDRFYYYYYY